MNFWIAVFVLLALALAILLLPLMRAVRGQRAEHRQQQNIKIAREKKSQLQAQLDEAEIDQAAYDSADIDLQTSLALELDSNEVDSEQAPGKWMAFVVLLAIPVASVLLYLTYGEYRVIENPQLVTAAHSQQAAAAPQMTLDEMTTAIKQRLKDNPEDAEGWFMLGKTYMAQQKFDKAITAYQRTFDLVGNEPGVMFSLADALAMQKEGVMLGEPEQLVKRGLEISPQDPTGLWLAGLAAEQRQDYKSAHAFWTRLLPLNQGDPASKAEIRELIQKLEQHDPQLTVAVSGGRVLNLSISLSDNIRQLAAPGDSVFVYAKAMDGPPMPLAVKRLSVRDLPAQVSLSNDDAMLPNMNLSAFDRVIVGARVSKSGNPVAQPGDLFVEYEGVDSSNFPSQIDLSIDKIK